MASSETSSGGRIRETIQKISESLNEQQWFQELKAKWEELDPQSRTYLKFASAGGALLILLLTVFSFVWGVYSLKRELSEKNELLHVIQSANDELRRLREAAPTQGEAAKGDTNWQASFEATAASLGIEKNSLVITPVEKAADKAAAPELAKESLFDIQVKHVSIKQVIRFAYALEHGNKPVKLRNLFVDTGADPAGYMDAKLSVSAFTLPAAK